MITLLAQEMTLFAALDCSLLSGLLIVVVINDHCCSVGLLSEVFKSLNLVVYRSHIRTLTHYYIEY